MSQWTNHRPGNRIIVATTWSVMAGGALFQLGCATQSRYVMLVHSGRGEIVRDLEQPLAPLPQLLATAEYAKLYCVMVLLHYTCNVGVMHYMYFINFMFICRG